VKTIKIKIKPDSTRLDQFVAEKDKLLSRSRAKKLIKEGFIKVNNRSMEPSYIVKRGDLIKIEIPSPKPIEVKPENIPIDIIYEDGDFLVINKKAGMVVHPTQDHPSETLVNALLYHFGNLPGIAETLRPGIVHRLDKGTSGLLVVAKKVGALENLKNQFKSKKVIKKYLLLVGGRVEKNWGKIVDQISRHPKDPRRFTIDQSGKEAETSYTVLERFKNATFLEVVPKTGRTHQIRVHLSHIGHPIVGDRLYGGKPLFRIFLHSAYLEFTHPSTGKRVSFESELPVDLQNILIKLKKDD